MVIDPSGQISDDWRMQQSPRRPLCKWISIGSMDTFSVTLQCMLDQRFIRGTFTFPGLAGAYGVSPAESSFLNLGTSKV